jgi:predicted esterase
MSFYDRCHFTAPSRRLLLILLWLLVASAAPAAERTIFDIPRLDGVVIDGKADDWGNRGFDAGLLARVDEPDDSPTDGSATLRIGWDDRGLLVLLNVKDDIFVEPTNDEVLVPGDMIKVFVYDFPGAIGGWSARLSPGMDPKHPDVRILPWDERTPLKLTYTLEAKRTKTDGGYQMEMLLPWENLHRTPAPGQTVAFQLAVDDMDAPQQPSSERLFYPHRFVYYDTDLNVLRLADKPSPALSVTTYAHYENFEYADISLESSAEQAGTSLEIRRNNKTLATAKLKPNDGDHPHTSWCDVRIPLPLPPADLDGMAVYRDGNRIAGIELPDLNIERRTAFAREPLYFKPSVFSGEKFPAFEFPRPGLIEHLIGRYKAQITFYDSDQKEVSRAERPGRYGAVVELKCDDGQTYRKYCTLFRAEKPLGRWGGPRLTATTMPAELGLNPRIVQETQDTISDFLGWTVPDGGFYNNRDFPALLSWLFESNLSMHAGPNPWIANQKWWAPIRDKYGDLMPKYIVHLPESYDADKAKRWPLLLHLHASNIVGDDLDMVRRAELPALVATKKDFPFVMVSPQCRPDDNGWNVFALDALLDEVCGKYRIDADRIYVTGGSMGGFGTWDLAAQYPDRFAAIAPVAGGLDTNNPDAMAQKLKDLPIWIFHGRNDHTVSIEPDDKMAAALRKAHARVRYTVYPDYGHVIGPYVYEQQELWDWLLAQRRGAPTQQRVEGAASTQAADR